jgi:hypothetical protein
MGSGARDGAPHRARRTSGIGLLSFVRVLGAGLACTRRLWQLRRGAHVPRDRDPKVSVRSHQGRARRSGDLGGNRAAELRGRSGTTGTVPDSGKGRLARAASRRGAGAHAGDRLAIRRRAS